MLRHYRTYNKNARGWYLEYLNVKYARGGTLYKDLEGDIGVERIWKATLKYFQKSNEDFIKKLIATELNVPLWKRYLGYLLGSKDDDMGLMSDVLKRDCIEAKFKLNLKAVHFEKMQRAVNKAVAALCTKNE